MRKNIHSVFYALLLLFALIPSVGAADNAPSGVIQVGNRAYEDATLSFDAELSGDSVRGQLAAVVFTESGQFRNCSFYPAASAVHVRLRDVSGADFVKAVWLDENFCPLAEPAILRMPDNGALAYANFADDLRNLMEHSAGAGAEASDMENPYALARLIVRCDALPDLSRFPVTGRAQGPDGLYVLQFQNAAWAEQCAAYLRTCSSVRYVEPDAVIQIQEPDAASLSAYGEGAESSYLSWGAETTGIGKYAEYLAQDENRDGVTVAVVDSGADLGHPFLAGRLLPGCDILRGNSEPQDEFGHGTHVAGIIVDCTPNLNVKILPVRTLDAAGGCGSLALIASAIRWAADNGANVINLSLSAPASACVDEAVQYALDKNITVVTAAGNQYADTDKRSPARVTDAITVAAVNAANGRFPYSNYGDAVDLSAPGEGVFSAYLCGQGDNGGDYRTLSGTSMAAPHVSAAAALLLCERGVSQTPAQISAALRDAALDAGASGWDRYYGDGTLNMLPFVPQPEPLFYALLYADGELVFQNTQTPDDGRTALHTYPVQGESHGNAEYAAWYEQRKNIRKVTFAETVRPESTALWFYDCASLTEISGLENLDVSGVTNMSQMFALCENLTELDLTAFDTATVTDMSQMFFGCAKLETIYASGSFSTDAVMSDEDMFDGCASLIGGAGTKYDDARTGKDYARIDGGAENPGYFTNGNVYAILYSDGTLTFQHGDTPESGKTVTKIYEVDLNAVYTWDSDKHATTPWYNERQSLRIVNFADKISPSVTAYWFKDCYELKRLENIQNLDTSNVTDMSFMFDNCSELTALDLSHFDTSNVTSMDSMFSVCSELTVLDLSHFDTANVTDMRGMFAYCYSLKTIYASKKFTTVSVTRDSYMFYECTELVGGKGTRVDHSHMNKEYARIDNIGPPGYFTTLTPAPSDVYAILYSDGTLTFQHGNTPESGKTVTKTYEVDLDAAYAETSLEYSNRIPWYNERKSINVVNFVDKISPTATAGWFFDCTNLGVFPKSME